MFTTFKTMMDRKALVDGSPNPAKEPKADAPIVDTTKIEIPPHEGWNTEVVNVIATELT
jgi:hypothetical protein